MIERKYKISILFLAGLFILGLTPKNLFAREDVRIMQQIETGERVASSPANLEVRLRSQVKYTSDGMREPFKGFLKEAKAGVPIAQKAEAAVVLPELTVQGIIWGGRFPQAIINNRVLRVGNTIEGVEVIKIDKVGITVSYSGREYNLSSPAAVNFQAAKNPQGGKNEK